MLFCILFFFWQEPLGKSAESPASLLDEYHLRDDTIDSFSAKATEVSVTFPMFLTCMLFAAVWQWNAFCTIYIILSFFKKFRV